MGSRRTRARLVAASVVGTALLASFAFAFVVTESAPTSNRIPPGVPARVVFSIRNDNALPLRIMSINITNTTIVACMPLTNAKPVASNFNDLIAPGKQQQFYVETTTGINAVAPGPCQYMIDFALDTTVGFQQLDITFVPDSTTYTKVDIEPRLMSFGSQSIGSSEDQHVYISNYSGGTLSGYRVQLSGSGYSFADAMCAGQSCFPSPIAANGYQDLIVRCAPPGSGQFAGSIAVFGSGAGCAAQPLGSNALSCSGILGAPQIYIMPKPISIVATVNTTASATVTISNSGMMPELLRTLTLTGASTINFASSGNCSGQSCTYGMPGLPLGSTQVAVTCSPTDTLLGSAQLLAQGSSTTDSTTVTCMGTSSPAPYMTVSPASITIPQQIPVNGSDGPHPVTISNIGSQTLLGVQATLTGIGAADWQVIGNCVTSTCSIPMAGSEVLQVTFRPHTHGDRHAMLHVNASNFAPPFDVDLQATASGSVLVINPLDIQFGTLPRNQLSQHDVTATNAGNTAMFVSLSPPSPFSVGSDVANGFSLGGGEIKTFKVGCGSAVAMTYDSTIGVTGMSPYIGATQGIHVNCTVAPTDIRVTPTDYDYGEVFRGTPAVTKNIAIKNPTGSAIVVGRLQLIGTRPGLELTGGFTSPMSLQPGASIMAALTLTPTDETDLTGVRLEIDAQMTTLSYPVSGKVVTPHSYVTPERLDLGTACVGTQVKGTEMLINDGTATLLIGPPVMDAGFRTMFTSPSTYPTNLAPGGHANVDLVPSTSRMGGALHGHLTWDDSVPNHWGVDVDLTYISDGPALSPRALAFGTVNVNAISQEQTITIENCGLTPVRIRVLDIVTSHGRADAWRILPGNGYAKTLGTHDKVTIAASFAPLRNGHYDAQLRLDVNSTTQSVALVGDALGLEAAKTSFYACGGCTGEGAPVRGWPIACALGFVIARKRRRR